MLIQITDIAKGFVGNSLDEREGETLSMLCEAALAHWTKRLLPEVSAEQCAAAIIPAAAWTALCGFLAAREAGEPFLAFTAGDVSVRYGEDGKAAVMARLQSEAQRLMAPYTIDERFSFRGVRG